MYFLTIWTLKGLWFRERISRTRDWVAMTIAAHLPLRIRYWTTILEIGRATKNSPNVPATQLTDILHNLNVPKNLS